MEKSQRRIRWTLENSLGKKENKPELEKEEKWINRTEYREWGNIRKGTKKKRKARVKTEKTKY